MHDIEPFYKWREFYIPSEDPRSPFYQRRSATFYDKAIYNYVIHPDWDAFGSSTLYLKVLSANYDTGTAIIEMIGEWNDAVHNDIMYLKRDVIEPMLEEGITKFILICDNLLNFHAPDFDDYYSEWAEEVRDAYPSGYIVLLNTRKHIEEEMEAYRLDHYLLFGEDYNELNWRILKPDTMAEAIDALVGHRIRRIG